MPDRLRLSQIRIDGGTQPRASINAETVNEYAEAMTEGASFPPVVVFYDGSIYWLADGFHRHAAAKQNGFLDIGVEIHPGTRQEAKDYACSGKPNSAHGLRESKGDRERRVMAMVKDHSDWTDTRIANHCGVSQPTVSRYRNTSYSVNKIEQPSDRTVTRGDTTYTMKVARIGKREEREPVVEPAKPKPSPYVEVERQPVHVPEPISGDDADSLKFRQWMNRISGRAYEIGLSGIPTEKAFALALGESYRKGFFILT